MKRLVLITIAAGFLVASTGLKAIISAPVKIDSGLVEGTASGQPSVRVFKGIPIAAPPLGENRWKAPQPWRSRGSAGRSTGCRTGCRRTSSATRAAA